MEKLERGLNRLNSDNIDFDNMRTAVIKACAMASFCVANFGVQNIINQKVKLLLAETLAEVKRRGSILTDLKIDSFKFLKLKFSRLLEFL